MPNKSSAARPRSGAKKSLRVSVLNVAYVGNMRLAIACITVYTPFTPTPEHKPREPSGSTKDRQNAKKLIHNSLSVGVDDW